MTAAEAAQAEQASELGRFSLGAALAPSQVELEKMLSEQATEQLEQARQLAEQALEQLRQAAGAAAGP